MSHAPPAVTQIPTTLPLNVRRRPSMRPLGPPVPTTPPPPPASPRAMSQVPSVSDIARSVFSAPRLSHATTTATPPPVFAAQPAPDPFVRPPAVLPPDPLRGMRARAIAKTNAPLLPPPPTRPLPALPRGAPTQEALHPWAKRQHRPPRRIADRVAGHPPTAQATPAPLTTAPQGTARGPKDLPDPPVPQAPQSADAPVWNGFGGPKQPPHLVRKQTPPHISAPPCIVLSLHPLVDAAAQLLSKPDVVWSCREDATRVVEMLAHALPHVPGVPPPASAQANLWRGIAKARLQDASAKTELMQVLRRLELNHPHWRAALVHLLPALVSHAAVGPQGQARDLAEGYTNVALADFPSDPFVRLTAALLALRVGDVARAREALIALTQMHPGYSPAPTVLAAICLEAYTHSHDAADRARALRWCKRALATGGHRDMALCLLSVLVQSDSHHAGQPSFTARMTQRYEALLTRPIDVYKLPVVVLDPAFCKALPAKAQGASQPQTPSQQA